MADTVSPAWERLRILGFVEHVAALWRPGLLAVTVERGSKSFAHPERFVEGRKTPNGYVGTLPLPLALKASEGAPTMPLVESASLLSVGAAPRSLAMWVNAKDQAGLLYGEVDGVVYANELGEAEDARFERILPTLGPDAKRAQASSHVVIVASARWHARLPGSRALGVSGLRVLTAPASLAQDLIVRDMTALGYTNPKTALDTYMPGMYPQRVPIVQLGEVSVAVSHTRVLPGGTLVDLGAPGFAQRGGDA